MTINTPPLPRPAAGDALRSMGILIESALALVPRSDAARAAARRAIDAVANALCAASSRPYHPMWRSVHAHVRAFVIVCRFERAVCGDWSDAAPLRALDTFLLENADLADD